MTNVLFFFFNLNNLTIKIITVNYIFYRSMIVFLAITLMTEMFTSYYYTAVCNTQTWNYIHAYTYATKSVY